MRNWPYLAVAVMSLLLVSCPASWAMWPPGVVWSYTPAPETNYEGLEYDHELTPGQVVIVGLTVFDMDTYWVYGVPGEDEDTAWSWSAIYESLPPGTSGTVGFDPTEGSSVFATYTAPAQCPSRLSRGYRAGWTKSTSSRPTPTSFRLAGT